MRPGYLSHIPLKKRNNFRGLGYFGKGAMLPPPTPIPTGPAVFMDGKWECEGAEPPAEVDGYWHCCPSGWKKVKFGATRPCPGDEDLEKCGPPPEGMDLTSVKCCAGGRWAVVGDPESDPCALPGYKIPTTEEILADEIEVETGPVITPVMMAAAGVVVVSLLGLALLAS